MEMIWACTFVYIPKPYRNIELMPRKQEFGPLKGGFITREQNSFCFLERSNKVIH